MMHDKPVVSVAMITYGHENYIGEAINGVYMQLSDFPIELIIANDNSPDQTDEVVKNIIDKAPANITVKYTKHDTNKGMMLNFIWVLEQATGHYIALCEGDDFWTDPLKLQKQVDFLEENGDFILSFTDRLILKGSELQTTKQLHTQSVFAKSDIPNIHIPTLTVLFRNVKDMIPRKMRSSLIDTSLFLFLSQFGKFHYAEEKTSVYRVHDNGIYSGNSDLVNFKRSAKARLDAWLYLKNIDRLSLADNIIICYRLQKHAAIRQKDYLSVFTATLIESFFVVYLVFQKKLRAKRQLS